MPTCQEISPALNLHPTIQPESRPPLPVVSSHHHIATREDDPPPARTFSPLRRSLAVDESAQYRHQPSNNRFSTRQDAPTPGIRRSSNFSEYSLREARKLFQCWRIVCWCQSPVGLAMDWSMSLHIGILRRWRSRCFRAAAGWRLRMGAQWSRIYYTAGPSCYFRKAALVSCPAFTMQILLMMARDWYHFAKEIRKKEEYIRGHNNQQRGRKRRRSILFPSNTRRSPRRLPHRTNTQTSPTTSTPRSSCKQALHQRKAPPPLVFHIPNAGRISPTYHMIIALSIGVGL